jgi:hypothetical protein
MTLLTICNAIADTTSGPRPATIIGNTNPEAQSYLRSVTKVGLRLMKVYPWNILRKENTFSAPGTETLIAAASMPSDFDRFIPETFWDRSETLLLSGPVPASRWQSLKAEAYAGDNYVFTYRGGNVLAIPTVSSGNSMVFEYISNQHIESSGGSAQSTWQADTDVSLLDEELLALAATYDWLSSEGLPAQNAFAEFKTYFDMLQDNENATENILVTGDIFARESRHWTGTPIASRSVSVGD